MPGTRWHQLGWETNGTQPGVRDLELARLEGVTDNFMRSTGTDASGNEIPGLREAVEAWNDYAGPVGSYRALNMVYPTDDGVIDTVQWEGYREGIDDIKYATTLMQAVAKGENSKNASKMSLAAEAEKYIEEVDLSGDLDTVREQIIDYILRLRG